MSPVVAHAEGGSTKTASNEPERAAVDAGDILSRTLPDEYYESRLSTLAKNRSPDGSKHNQTHLLLIIGD